MRNSYYLKLVPALLSFTVMSAQAEVIYPSFFVGGNLGYQLADDDNYSYSDPGAPSLGLSAGVQFNDDWRWDIGYQYSDTFVARENNIELTPMWFETALRYDWLLKEKFKAYARFGAAYWDVEKKIIGVETRSTQGISPLGEVGVSYAMTPNVDIEGGFKYINEIGDKYTGRYDNNSFVVNLNYKFINEKKVVEKKEVKPELKPRIPVISPPMKKVITTNEESYITYFAFASSKVNTGSLELKKVLDILNKYPQSRLILTGNTDSIGSYAANQRLSQKRAESVARFFTDRGISISRMTIRADGETNPIASNITAVGRSQNLRVDMNIPSFSYEEVVAR
ncbi:OmpA family protein [Aliivibrio fischeri]|uniref:OmpA family protein n=1 Tax=Aliivibrio fischeri TaxID=668 RepID=UPI0012DAB9E4|nr:OmpA family protein [Aliivibrio fischeri]MUL11502.1 outer membrane beta-barrel protein [Aliivibrio fischeri]MUL15423.1 outer membrane beta-barrel protein [Aliivibrio fischeri]